MSCFKKSTIGGSILKIRLGSIALSLSLLLSVPSALLAKSAPAAPKASAARALPLGSTVNRVAANTFRDRLFQGRVSSQVAVGENLMLAGKYSQAQDAFRQAVNQNSRDRDALTGLGLALAMQFKLDAADEQLAKAIKVNPKTPLALAGQALVKLYRLQSSSMTIISQKQALLNGAEASCKQALAIDNKLAEAYIVLGLVQKEQGRLADAKNTLSKAIKLDPKYGNAFVQRGLIELKTGDAASALADFGAAIALRSDNSTAYYGLGKAYLAQNLLDDAYKSLNTSISLNNNSAPAHIAMGDVYRQQGNRVAAIKEYQVAINIKAESDDAYLRMADIRESRGDLELAMADLRSGLALNGNSVDLHRRTGDIALRLEKTDDALKEYTTVLGLAPGDTAAVEGMTRTLMIKAQKEANGAFFVSNNYESAENFIQRAIQLNPNNMELRLADAKLRAMSGQPVDLSTIGTPTNDAQRIAYAEACLAQFKYQEATQAMQTVIANCSNSASAFSVADMALMIRDIDDAESAYKRAGTYNDEDAVARSQRGLAACAAARQKAQEGLDLASDLAKNKQLTRAIDQFRNAAYLNPRLSKAHLGLAETLEKLFKDSAPSLREAALHYRAYAALEPGLPEKQAEKIARKADKCDEIAAKIEQGKPRSKLSSIFSTVESWFKN